MIEVRHLRSFVVLAEELHFGRAAERLHMAQSPLSQQIRRLEGELGFELVTRGHHVVGLTDAGRAFLAGARRTLGELESAERQARRAARGEVGTLVIGYVSEVTVDLLPLSLKAFKNRYPDIEIDLREGTTGQLLEALRRHRIDVAFTRSPDLAGRMQYEQLASEALTAALPDAGPTRQIALCDLSADPFVMPNRLAAEGLRRDIDKACAEAGFRPNVSRETSPLSAVLLLVAAGAGVALVPSSVAHLYPVPGVGYAELGPPAPFTTAGVAWRPGEASRIIEQFLDVTRTVARTRRGAVDVRPGRGAAGGCGKRTD